MSRRIFLIFSITLSLAAMAGATLMASRHSAAGSFWFIGQQPSGRPEPARPQPAARQVSPIRTPDPNLAPRGAADEALFATEEFFEVRATVMRPYSDALERINELVTRYPRDPGLRLHGSSLAERLGQFDLAAEEMVRYVELKQRSADSLTRLADFYRKRARPADEVRALLELARAVPIPERAPIYRQAAEVVRTRALDEFAPAEFFAELVAADPSNIQPLKDYVQELRLAERDREALDVLQSHEPRFPEEKGYFLNVRSAIHDRRGDRRAAEDVYSSAFDPLWPRAVAADYYNLLRKFGRYRLVRRGLQDQVRAGATDLETVSRLFSMYAYEGSYEQASRLLAELESRRAGNAASGSSGTPVSRSAWSDSELETVAGMFALVGDFDQASRYLYTLYLAGGLRPGSEAREHALHRLFTVMLDAGGNPTRLAAGDLSFYRYIAEVDRYPGFMNGVLSLVLADTEPARQFVEQERAAAGYFNRAFAHRIFTAFRQEYPNSPRLGGMYLGVVNAFASLGEHRLAIEAGREFQQRYPNSPSHAEVSLRIADSHVALGNRVAERQVLADLLDRLAAARPEGMPLIPVSGQRWSRSGSPDLDQLLDRIRYNLEAYSDTYEPTSDQSRFRYYDDYSWRGATVSRGPTYGAVVERYVSSLAAESRNTETLAFFWSEIRKHPAEEGLYERFLRWLGQAQLVNEQLSAYEAAIRQFDSNTWYHRLARWYVRQRRGADLSRYSRQLIEVFDEEEVAQYLVRFAGYGSDAASDGLNWSERLAFDLYTLAHDRFPGNLFFVRGMLTYLDNTDRSRWEQLSARYYFADRSIRDPYLAWLSRQDQLRPRYERARELSASAFGYQVFAADAALWISHHDEAIDAYRRLVAGYPGEPQYADRLADLTRSFGHESADFLEESARTLSAMATIHPSRTDYRIKAGEVLAEMGDFDGAGEQWNSIVQLQPGNRSAYLEVATVFWDYYQYDDAIRVLHRLREVSGDPSVYAYRVGAVHEARGEMDEAIAEYIKVLSEPGEGRDTAATRLAQLSRRTGMVERIAAAYERARTANPSDWQLILGYAAYHAERERGGEALSLLRTEVQSASDVAFLESVRDLFRALLRPEDELEVVNRLTRVARDEREAMMYRLQLAASLERQGQVDSAVAVIDGLTAEYPTNVGVIEESARFYWRAGLLDQALNLYARSLERARGPNRKSLTLQLARRQMEADRAPEAVVTLRNFHEENRGDTEVFAELAGALAAENRFEELERLYASAFEHVRESGLTGGEARERIAALRLGMARTLDGLGRRQDALDQYIEVVNAFPEDADRLATAIEYAERHDIAARLIDYYERLSREAFKNYRWQLVLGRIYERAGDLAGATAQYRAALVNEPQRADLRFSLASVLARRELYDEAVSLLREGWNLSGRDPEWLVEVAAIQVRRGERSEVAETIRQSLAARRSTRVQDIIQMAGRLAGWGLDADAVGLFDQAFDRLARAIEDEYLAYDDVGAYVRAIARAEPAPAAYRKIESVRDRFLVLAENSQDEEGWRARNVVSAFDYAASEFGKTVLEHANAADAASLASVILSDMSGPGTPEDREEFNRLISMARSAGLVEVEERILVRMKDESFELRSTPEDPAFHNDLSALVSFFNRRGAFVRAAELLAAEYQRDPYKDRFDYLEMIASQYRLAGNIALELEWLGRAYSAASGGVTTDHSDWVERYLEVLHDLGRRDQLEQLATRASPHQLQLINFLVARGEKQLARTAISNAGQSAAWAASRSGEVGLFLRDASAETDAFFRAALDIRPIGEMLGRKVDGAQSLVGTDWYIAARNYGFWLGLDRSKTPESRRLAVAEIERRPGSVRAQLELAAYYIDRADRQRASDHVALAAELGPGDRDVAVMRGKVALARGDRRAAIDAWAAMVGSRATLPSARAYLNVMAENGFLTESLPALESFMIGFVNRPPRGISREDRIEQIRPLVRDLAVRAGSEPGFSEDIAESLRRVLVATPGDLTLGRILIDENFLSERALDGIYRLVHARLSDIATATFGTPEYENGYWTGSGYFYPASALAEWRRKLLDYLIRRGAFDEAAALFEEIDGERADLALASEAGDDSREGTRYEWLPLAKASVAIRSGRNVQGAIAELRRYCGLDDSAASATPADPARIHERRLKAYALLIAENREQEADRLLYDSYRQSTRSRFADDASLAGLAEMEARRGRGEEAGRLLRLLVERSTDNLPALRLAAEVAARAGRFEEAVGFRRRIETANPADAVNRLELARAISAFGRTPEALDLVSRILEDRSTPNSIRVQASEVAGELSLANASEGERILAVFESGSGRGDAGASLAAAAVASALGRRDQARVELQRVVGGLLAPIAAARLGLTELEAGRREEARAHFERALSLDPDDRLGGAALFRSAGARALLIRLNNSTGRHLTAVRLADAEGGETLISAAMRSSAVTDFDQIVPGPARGVIFEPPLLPRALEGGIITLAARNQVASYRLRAELLLAVADSAARLGEYERALALERVRYAETLDTNERSEIQRRLDEILAAERARRARLEAALRIDLSNAAGSVFATSL